MKTPPLLVGAIEAFGGNPSRPAVVDDAGSWAWREFIDEVERTAVELAGAPDRGPVLIHSPSGLSFLVTFLAAAMAGRPACTLHYDWAKPELDAAVSEVSRFDPGCDQDPEDPVFYIGFTSGTSGRPKPFIRRQRSWSSSFAPAGEMFSVNPGDLVFLPGSLQHSHFLFGAVLGLNRGATVRLFERFDAGRLAEQLRQASRAVVYLVPTMLVALDELGAEHFGGVHSLVISGAKTEPHHWEIAKRLFPEARAGEIYGASELSFVTVNTGGEDLLDPGCVGRPFPGVELEIRSPDEASGGRPAAGEPGLVYVRSPYLFDGYINESGKDSPIGSDGFMTVGDIGVIGERGLSLVGRASNLLITGGKNVHPEEIEARMVEHPSVAECVVVGVPHPRWGEEIVAFVVTRNGDRPELDPLRAHLKQSLASYKVPKRWFQLDSIPKTLAGKTDRSHGRLFEPATEIK